MIIIYEVHTKLGLRGYLSGRQTGEHWWHFVYHQRNSQPDSPRPPWGAWPSDPWTMTSWWPLSFGTLQWQSSGVSSPGWCGLWGWSYWQKREDILKLKVANQLFIPHSCHSHDLLGGLFIPHSCHSHDLLGGLFIPHSCHSHDLLGGLFIPHSCHSHDLLGGLFIPHT